jgi:hypothetical protein
MRRDRDPCLAAAPRLEADAQRRGGLGCAGSALEGHAGQSAVRGAAPCGVSWCEPVFIARTVTSEA